MTLNTWKQHRLMKCSRQTRRFRSLVWTVSVIKEIIQMIVFFQFILSTGDRPQYTVITALSEGLMVNNTLTQLYLFSLYSVNVLHEKKKHSFWLTVRSCSTGAIGVKGMGALAKALKTNTTIIKLGLECKHQWLCCNIISFFWHVCVEYIGNDNRVEDKWAAELCGVLTVNTTLKELKITRIFKYFSYRTSLQIITKLVITDKTVWMETVSCNCYPKD